MTPGQRVEAVEKECSGVWAQSGITAWERNFLTSVKGRSGLTERQEETLSTIEHKAFGGTNGN